GDLQGGDDLAQVARHRLAQRQEADREVVEVAFELIDLFVAFDNARGKLAVAFDDRLDRVGELAFGQTAHLDDHLAEPAQLLVIALDDVLSRHASPQSSANPASPNPASAKPAGDVILGAAHRRVGKDTLGLVEFNQLAQV